MSRARLITAVFLAAALAAHAAEKGAATRTEHDLLGEKQVPAAAYYGVQTARALENFQFSGTDMNTYPEFVDGFIVVKLAAARANTKVGARKPDRLAAIEKAYTAIREGKYRDQFPVDLYQGGAGTSANMNVNEVMANVGLELTLRLRVAGLVVDQLVAAAGQLVHPVDAAAQVVAPDPEVELPLDPAGARRACRCARVVAAQRLEGPLLELQLVM